MNSGTASPHLGPGEHLDGTRHWRLGGRVGQCGWTHSVSLCESTSRWSGLQGPETPWPMGAGETGAKGAISLCSISLCPPPQFLESGASFHHPRVQTPGDRRGWGDSGGDSPFAQPVTHSSTTTDQNFGGHSYAEGSPKSGVQVLGS